MIRAKQFVPLLLAILVLMAYFWWRFPGFLSLSNMLGLGDAISVNAILAFGMTFCILIGGIDLSVGAVVALVGATTVCIVSLPGLSEHRVLGAGLAVLCGLAVAAAVGIFSGCCAAKTKMPSFIITLATMEIARGLALRFNEGLFMPMPSSQTLLLALGTYKIQNVIPVPMVVMLVLFASTFVLLHRTRFGQHVYAIGGNREAARFAGVPQARVEIAVYMLCAVMAGAAGIIQMSWNRGSEPTCGVGFELSAIAAAVVGGTSFTGGRGTMIGTLLGAVVIGILDKGLNQANVHHSFQHVIKGAVILGAVYIDTLKKR